MSSLVHISSSCSDADVDRPLMESVRCLEGRRCVDSYGYFFPSAYSGFPNVDFDTLYESIDNGTLVMNHRRWERYGASESPWEKRELVEARIGALDHGKCHGIQPYQNIVSLSNCLRRANPSDFGECLLIGSPQGKRGLVKACKNFQLVGYLIDASQLDEDTNNNPSKLLAPPTFRYRSTNPSLLIHQHASKT